MSASYFYFMELDDNLHAIPLPKVEATPPEALVVNVTYPPPGALLERCWQWEHRFEER